MVRRGYPTPPLCSTQAFTTQNLTSLVLVALGETAIDILRKVGRNHLAELLNVLPINSLGEPQSRVNNPSIESKEVLRNLAGSRILAVQARNKRSLLTVVVELEVDRSLREHGALELAECASNLGVLAGLHKPVFKNITELQVGAFHECEELSGTGVDMGRVDAAWLEEAESGADAQTSENGECLNIGGLGGSAFCSWSGCGIVETEDGKLPQGVSSEESLSLNEEPLEALDGCGSCEQIAEELSRIFCRRRDSGCRCRCNTLRKSLYCSEGCETGDEDLCECEHGWKWKDSKENETNKKS